MANTNYYKNHVEPHVRDLLRAKYGVTFHSRQLQLTTGSMHEFDAVSEDGKIVASIKSHSGKTASGKRPAAKYHACLAEMYYLSLVKAEQRILVLTTPEWHKMFTEHIVGRQHPDIKIRLVELSPEIQAEVDKVRDIASGEVTIAKPLGDKPKKMADVKPAKAKVSRKSSDVGFESGVRKEILDAFRHLHALGHPDLSPAEVLAYLHDRMTEYADSTILTYICSVLCGDAPVNHPTTYNDLERVGQGRYRLRFI